MNRKSILFFPALLCAIFFFSCAKQERTGPVRMQVRLTDDPGDYEAVLVDVRDVRINFSSDTSKGWVSLEGVRHGTYDLLQLVNDKDTLLADAYIPEGRIEQIRLVLGPDNFVVVDGERIRLETPSAQQSGLKINLHQQVLEGEVYQLLLDFDVARSILRTGNGKYKLKPTIRAMMQATGGSIGGVVVPGTFQTAVVAIKGSDTAASTYTEGGRYRVRGLQAGTYALHFIPTDPSYKKFVQEGVVVSQHALTTVDTVRLRK